MNTFDLQANKYRFFSVAGLGTFLSTLDASIMFVALPTMAEQLQVPVDTIAWVSLAYSLTLISLMLVFGAWTRNKGYRFAYRFGFILFFLGSLISALSVGIPQLIIGRVVQAIGGAMFQAIGPGLITTVFPKEERGKGIGLIVMVVSLGFMIGPPLGGFLLSVWHWSSLFYINLPVCIIGLLQSERVFRLMPKPPGHERVSVIGGAAMGFSLTGGMLALSFINDFGMFDYRVIVAAIFSVVALATFIKFESNPHTALIGFGVFKNRQFTTSLLAMTTQFISMAGVQVLFPFYLQQVRGYETETMGLFLVILPVMLMIFAPLSGKISDKIGVRLPTSVGVIVFILGLILTAGLTVSATAGYISICLVVIGAGAGIFGTPNSSAFMGSVTDQQRPIASGILSSTRNIGMSAGIAISTALFTWLQQRYALNMDANSAFLGAFEKVVYVSIAVAVFGLPFCLVRQNRPMH